MKILVVGSGGREHTLAWKLLQSPQVSQVLCTPGNGGTATLKNCQNYPVAVDDFEGIKQVAQENQVDLVVVGPELPLTLGINDYLAQYNIKVFGPKQDGAQIEGSKSWAKKIMSAAGVPTARSQTFTEVELAKAYLREQGAPIVVKADGLAAGKGVIVAMTEQEALAAIDTLSAAGFKQFLIEEFLTGEEVSVLALTDGITLRTLLPSQDHKPIGEGDTGANTGGMGAYCPAPIAPPAMMERIEQEILAPTLAELRRQGIDYRGVLYAGLMVTPEGEPKILEYNCRFGDPETQAVLPLLETPLEELLLACAEQRLAQLPPLTWYEGSAICVVMASQGYPGSYAKGKVIQGIEAAESLNTTVFHAGTELKAEKWLTQGGRVLGITARGESFEEAQRQVYQGVECIDFEGKYYRKDIGYRVFQHKS